MKQNIGLKLANEVGCLTCHRTESLVPSDFDLKQDGSGFTLTFAMPKGWALSIEKDVQVVKCQRCVEGKAPLAESDAPVQAKPAQKAKKAASA